MNGDALRYCRSSRSAVAELSRPLKVPLEILRFDPEIMIEHRANPDAIARVVLGHSEPLAAQVLGLAHSRVDVHQNIGVEKATDWEDWEGVPVAPPARECVQERVE